MRRAAAVLAAALLAAGCGGAAKAVPSPAPAKAQLVMAILPTNQPQPALAAAQPVADYLSRETGTQVTAQVPASLAATASGLSARSIDIAWLSALAYVAMPKAAGAEVVTRTARCAPTYTAAAPPADCPPVATYPSIIVCNTASGVGELRDGGDWSALKGKRFAFGDATSTAGSLWPRYYLAKNGVSPGNDFSRVATMASSNALALAVYDGIADCGAMAGDARPAVRRTAPDILDKTKVVFVAPEGIPGDPEVVQAALNPAQKAKVRKALLKLGHDPTMRKALGDLYQAASLEPAADRDYTTLRTVVARVDPTVTAAVIPPASPLPSPSASGARPKPAPSK